MLFNGVLQVQSGTVHVSIQLNTPELHSQMFHVWHMNKGKWLGKYSRHTGGILILSVAVK